MADVSARELAADSLMQILENGAFSSAVTAEVYSAYPDLPDRDRRLYLMLAERTLEELILIDRHINRVSNLPVRKMKPFIRAILRVSACQILFLDRIPDHAAVSEAVRITQKRGFGNLKGFVNGVLRSLIRRKDESVLPDQRTMPAEYLSVRYSCPEWIVRQWADRFGMQKTEEILKAFHAKKPLCLWVNPVSKGSSESLIRELSEAGVDACLNPSVEGVLFAENLDRIGENAAFRSGRFYIQDFSSILSVLPALSCLKEKKGPVRVIDVCGAPGGKSLYLAAHLPNAQVFCRDLSEQKTEKIRENVRRLGLRNVTVQTQDALVLHKEDVGTADLIIADLPCSGLGVIGRKADLRYRVKVSDQASLADLQKQILSTVFQYVKPGGFLMYSTCTVSETENEAQAKWIAAELELAPEALSGLPENLPLSADTAKKGYLQILPAAFPYCDGFFMSLFRKEGA